jgi:hypothetical protein
MSSLSAAGLAALALAGYGSPTDEFYANYACSGGGFSAIFESTAGCS